MSCSCRVCTRAMLVEALVQKLPSNEDKQFLYGLVSDLDHTEMERDHNAAILDGTWPPVALAREDAENKAERLSNTVFDNIAVTLDNLGFRSFLRSNIGVTHHPV